jgi:hypothetical protein
MISTCVTVVYPYAEFADPNTTPLTGHRTKTITQKDETDRRLFKVANEFYIGTSKGDEPDGKRCG